MCTLFETDRLRGRRWRPDDEADVAAAFAVYSDWEVVRWLGREVSAVESHESQRALLAARVEADSARGDGTGLFALERREDGVVVGSLVFAELPDGDGVGTGDYEVGWHLAQPFWGQGLASEGGRAVLAYGFRTLPHLPGIYALAMPANVRSLSVMDRLGMERLGTTRRYYGVEAVLAVARRCRLHA